MGKYIYLEVFNGLGNRLRAIDSVCELANLHGYRIILIWPVFEGASSPFQKLMQYADPIDKVIDLRKDTIPQRFIMFAKQAIIYFSNPMIVKLNHKGTRNTFDSKHYDNLQQALKSGRSFYLKTSKRLSDGNVNYQWLVPAKEIFDQKQTIADTFDLPNCIGLHIRRGDNMRSVGVSTREKFINVVEQEITSNSSCKVFLVSDSEQEKQYFRDSFPNHILINPETILDKTMQGNTIDAFVDLLCLAECKCIYSSYWSSFSIEAALVGGKEMIVVN